jgi:translation elongation factor EF-G
MIARGVKPLLHISKIDRLIAELGLTSEEIYQTLERHITHFNYLLAQAQPPNATEEISVSVFDGSVSFGSSRYGWAFTLPQIARSFVVSNGSSYEKILPLLWGDNFFDRFSSKVVPYSHTANGKAIRFCSRVLLTPLIHIFKHFGPEYSVKTRMTDVQKKILTLCNVPMTDDQWSSFTTARERLTYFLSRWMPLKEAFAEQVLTHTKDSRL